MIDLDAGQHALHTPIPPAFQCDVLAVDDDELTRAHLVSLLRRAGYQVHGAGSGAEALSVLGATPCSIVVTDWQMPDMDGLTLCRRLKLGANERHTYVVMLTVRSAAADILAGLEAGIDDYVIKGTAAGDLLARIAAARSISRVQHSPRIARAESLRISEPDPLTGAQTRRFLAKHLALELERSRRQGLPTALMSCDIDQIERINLRSGRRAGDQVLRAFVARSKACLRESVDQIARVGGDEFIIALPETTLDAARAVAQSIRRTFSDTAVATAAGPVQSTVSIGVTALETAGQRADTPLEEFIRAADRCLYISKAGGGGRTTCLPFAAAALLESPGDSQYPQDVG